MKKETILQKTKEKLPQKQWIEKIQDQLKENNQRVYSEMTIRQVMNGNRDNEQVLKAAIQVANKHQQEMEDLTNSL